MLVELEWKRNFSLAGLIKNKRNIYLTVVGAEKQTSYKINQSNIKLQLNQSNKARLIKYYDDHNIFVLPSFTEGHPMVLLEALARRRPVVIFLMKSLSLRLKFFFGTRYPHSI